MSKSQTSLAVSIPGSTSSIGAPHAPGCWPSFVGGCEMEWSKEDVERARESLSGLLKPGDTVHCILRHVSRSGMLRVIEPVLMRWDPKRKKIYTLHIGYNVAALTGMTYDRDREGVRVGGCGMDMGFHLVYSLSSYLWPKGFKCIGDRCPANDHTNGDTNRKRHLHKNSGGYALRHQWL